MNIWKLLFFIIGLIGSLNAHDYFLHGKVINYSEDGTPFPVEEVTIGIEGTGSKLEYDIKKNSGGRFHIDLAPKGKVLIGAGEKVRLSIDSSNNWFMLAPYNGEFFLPKDSKNQDIEVILLANNSQIKRKHSSIKLFNGKKEKVQYCIQILSVKSLWSAKKARDEFNSKWKKKYRAYIETVKVNENKFYKVLIIVKPYSKFNVKILYQKIRKVFKYRDAFIRLTVR